MSYIKQLIEEIRQSPVSIWLSISGTALSIFMIMVLFIRNNFDTVDAAPESLRSSTLIGRGIHIKELSTRYSHSSDGLRRIIAEMIYKDLKGIKDMAYFDYSPSTYYLSLNGGITEKAMGRMTDDNYWRLLDFDFIDGRPFTQEECDSTANVMIITDKLARRYFQSTDVAGRIIELNKTDFRIVGVVKQVNPLFQNAYADFYIPIFDYGDPNPFKEDGSIETAAFMGEHHVMLIKEPGVSDEEIRDQIKKRYEQFNLKHKRDSIELIYHGAPYDVETNLEIIPAEGAPDTGKKHRMNFLIYAILLLVPAINLSGISRSRISKRITEIGIRRAFGATRLDIIRRFLGENMIVTVVGGVIGLILSLLFVGLFSYLFIPIPNNITKGMEFHPSSGMLFNWQIFLWALGFCFILNLLSYGIPVWHATRITPADAITKKR